MGRGREGGTKEKVREKTSKETETLKRGESNFGGRVGVTRDGGRVGVEDPTDETSIVVRGRTKLKSVYLETHYVYTTKTSEDVYKWSRHSVKKFLTQPSTKTSKSSDPPGGNCT